MKDSARRELLTNKLWFSYEVNERRHSTTMRWCRARENVSHDLDVIYFSIQKPRYTSSFLTRLPPKNQPVPLVIASYQKIVADDYNVNDVERSGFHDYNSIVHKISRCGELIR
jgi:hypothetical protein